MTFWPLEPEIEDAKKALETAKKVKEFVLDRLKGRHTDNSWNRFGMQLDQIQTGQEELT